MNAASESVTVRAGIVLDKNEGALQNSLSHSDILPADILVQASSGFHGSILMILNGSIS